MTVTLPFEPNSIWIAGGFCSNLAAIYVLNRPPVAPLSVQTAAGRRGLTDDMTADTGENNRQAVNESIWATSRDLHSVERGRRTRSWLLLRDSVSIRGGQPGPFDGDRAVPAVAGRAGIVPRDASATKTRCDITFAPGVWRVVWNPTSSRPSLDPRRHGGPSCWLRVRSRR